MNLPSIYLRDICLEYQHIKLFKQFNLDLPAGKFVCLLGPSGVGKTTLLKLIAGLVTGTQVLRAKIETSDQKSLKNRIVYMAQQDGLMPWLNVIDNTLIGYRLRKKRYDFKKLRVQAQVLLDRVGLSDVIHLYPNQLSGGMRQRVALVRTLMENRPIVLMDEPFSSLDAISRIRLQNLAASLLVNRTVFLVTHNPLEALRLGDIIYVLSGKPVRLSQPIILSTAKPRKANSELLKLEAQLLNTLTEADKEFCVC